MAPWQNYLIKDMYQAGTAHLSYCSILLKYEISTPLIICQRSGRMEDYLGKDNNKE